MSANTIEVLAKQGIDVDNRGKLLQDDSIQIYQDGHLHDFGRGGIHYFNVDDFIEDRKDLHDAPVQANTSLKISTPKYNVEGIYNSYKIQFEQLDATFKTKALYDFIPEAFWSNGIPESIGYSFKENSLTVSVFDGDIVKATTVRRSYDVKWRTYGSKIFIPTRLTGKDDVYIASGMGEIVLMDLLGVDYIGMQFDGAMNHLQDDLDIKHLIILPDNDDAFLKGVDKIVSTLKPEKASIVKWEHADPREAAIKLESRDKFMTEVADNLEEIVVPKKVSYDLDFENVVTDENDDKFAEIFTDIAVNEFGFTPYAELTHNWKVLSHTLRKAMMGAGASSALTMGAGEGKSTGTALFIAHNICNNARSAMVVVNLLSNGREVVDNINKWSGTTEALLVDGSMKNTDTTKVRVLVITHAMLKATLYGNGRRGIDDLNTFYNKPRDLIVIDEAIDLRKSHTVTLQQLEHLCTTLSLINSKKTEDIRKTIAWFIDIVAKNNSLDIVEKESVPDDMTADFGVARAILKSRFGSTPDQAMGLPWNKVVDDVEVLISSNYFTIRTGAKTHISTAADYMPKDTSIVILDASADIDEIYYQYQGKGLIDIVKTKNARSFNNATLYARQVGASKYEMLTEDREVKEDVLAVIESEVYEKTEPSDKILIISHKEVKDEMDLLAWKDRDVITMNWGDITGRNDARNCNKVFIFGLSFKPRVEALNKMYAINGNTTDRHLEGRYRNTDIIAEAYQAIMRSALRVPQDDHDCIKTDVYITIPNAISGTSAQLRKLIGTTLEKKLNGATLKEWEIDKKPNSLMDTLFAEGTWFNTYRKPATKLSPTLKKMQRFLLNEAKSEKALDTSKYHGIISMKDMANFIKGRDENIDTVEGAIRKTLNRANVNQLALLTGWTYDRYEVYSVKAKRNVKMRGFRPVDE